MKDKNEQLGYLKDIYGSNRKSNNANRTWLTVGVMVGGLILIVVFGLVYVFDSNEATASENVFNALIPLIASWIGTVLAFYFGRENMEAAADRFLTLNSETLDDIPVENVMIDLGTMVFEDDDPDLNGNLKLLELVESYKKIRKDRIPFLTKDKLSPQYIIHISFIESFLATYKGEDPNISKLTINNLIQSDQFRDHFGFEETHGFVVVGPRTSLELAIENLNKIDQGRDIFITEGGKENGRVIGWITDSLIDRFLQLKTR